MRLLKKDTVKIYYNENKWFVLFLSVFFILFFILQNINNRFWLHDYEVYYSAAKSFVNGEQVYNISYGLGTGLFKYSPFSLLLFAPFSLLPFFVAKALHFIILSGFIAANIILSEKLIRTYFYNENEHKKHNLKLFLIFLPLIPNVYTELHLGNVNSILLFIFIAALYVLISGREYVAGLLLALGILIKPHFLILLPLLLVRKKFKCIATLLAGIVTGILLPLLFTGIQNYLALHKQWILTMQTHNLSLISGQDTIYSWAYRLLGRFIYPETVSHDKILGISILLLISLTFLTLMIFHFKKEKPCNAYHQKNLSERNFIFEYILLLALVPNITVTDSEHFLLSIPLIAYLVLFLSERKKNIPLQIITIIIIVLYGMNMRELIGTTFSSWLTANGMLGLANMLVITICVIIRVRFFPRRDTMESLQ